jgi:hypothetical protein
MAGVRVHAPETEGFGEGFALDRGRPDCTMNSAGARLGMDAQACGSGGEDQGSIIATGK